MVSVKGYKKQPAFGISLEHFERSTLTDFSRIILDRIDRLEDPDDLELVPMLYAQQDDGYCLATDVVSQLPEGTYPAKVQLFAALSGYLERYQPANVCFLRPAKSDIFTTTIFLLSRNIWGRRQMSAYDINHEENVFLEPSSATDPDNAFFDAMLRIHMHWTGLRMLRGVGDFESWALACRDAEKDAPCPCGSDLLFKACCSDFRLDARPYLNS